MQVFVVINESQDSGGDGHSWPIAFFSSKERAERFVDRGIPGRGSLCIEEFELDDEPQFHRAGDPV